MSGYARSICREGKIYEYDSSGREFHVMIRYARLVGYAVIFLCPAAAGMLMGKRAEEQVRRLESVILMIQHIRYEIEERMTPHNGLFERFENKTLERCGFLGILKKCRADGEKSVLSKAIEIYGDLFLYESCNTMLCDFAESLGKLSQSAQLERCDSYRERFNSVYAEKSEKLQGEKKLCRSMGILCGAAAVLILL